MPPAEAQPRGGTQVLPRCGVRRWWKHSPLSLCAPNSVHSGPEAAAAAAASPGKQNDVAGNSIKMVVRWCGQPIFNAIQETTLGIYHGIYPGSSSTIFDYKSILQA